MGLVRDRNTFRVMTDTTWIVENKSKRPPQPLTAEFMEHNHLDPVFEGSRPSITAPYETVASAGVEQIDGKWTTKYIVGPIFKEFKDEEGKTVTVETQTANYKASVDTRVAQKNRNQRNKLLAETDWTQGRDVVLSNDAAWKTYRQALRDLPTHSKWPHLESSDWPTKP